jgi:uncharacterized protein YchJ
MEKFSFEKISKEVQELPGSPEAEAENENNDIEIAKIVEKLYKKPVKYISRKKYRIEDYDEEWQEHPEWHGLSVDRITSEDGIKNGGNSFYKALLRYAEKNPNTDENDRRVILERYFPVKQIDRKKFTLSEYLEEWQNHPEWHGLSTHQMRDEERKKNGGASYYYSLIKYAKRASSGDNEKQRHIMEHFFPAKHKNREEHILNDYIKEWQEHPEWHGLSTHQMQDEERKRNGGNSFYQSLVQFAKKESGGDKKLYKKITERFFSAKYMDRKDYTMDDFEKEWQKHPEWHNLSTEQMANRMGITSGGNAFYKALTKFAKRESDRNKESYKLKIEHFFPAMQKDRRNNTLNDFIKEWNEHSEWHGLSTHQMQDKECSKNGGRSFYMALQRYAERESRGDEKKRREIIEYFFPWSVELIHADRGYILQHSLETILKIINNKNLVPQKPFKLSGRKRNLLPDLVYEYQDRDSPKAIIMDIKLQTTTAGIDKDKKNYSQILLEKYPDGGNIIFLCLNGPKFKNEESESNEKIKIRYYHALDWLERLTDNKKNKFLLHLIAGDNNKDISQVKDLTVEQINKINEIKECLEVLKKRVVERKNLTSKKEIQEELAKKTARIKNKIRDLANPENNNRLEIMNTNFKELLNF